MNLKNFHRSKANNYSCTHECANDNFAQQVFYMHLKNFQTPPCRGQVTLISAYKSNHRYLVITSKCSDALVYSIFMRKNLKLFHYTYHTYYSIYPVLCCPQTEPFMSCSVIYMLSTSQNVNSIQESMLKHQYTLSLSWYVSGQTHVVTLDFTKANVSS